MSGHINAETPATVSAVTSNAIEHGASPAPARRERLVVVGFGMIAYKLVERLAALEVLDRFTVTVIGEEPYPAYNRVHLTEWLDHRDLQRLVLGHPGWTESPGIRIVSGDPVINIDRDSGTVRTAGGERIGYDRLVLATGASPNLPSIDGADQDGVFVYRTLDDLKQISARADSARSAIVVGGGLLGIEAADALTERGLEVRLLESGDHMMRRQLDSEAAALLKKCLADKGVRTITGARVRRIERRDGDLVLTVKDHEQQLTAGMVVIAAGVRPRDELARQAGLEVADPSGGIVVDDALRTSDPVIHAIGDCASHDGLAWGLVAPGFRMAETLAERLAGGRNKFRGYAPAVRLRLAGIDIWSLGNPAERGVRVGWSGDASYRRITVRGRRILAAAAVGPWDEIGVAQDLIRHRRVPSPKLLHQFIRTGTFIGDAERRPVTAWPDSAMVCNCLEVTRGELGAQCAKGAASAEALAEATGASTVCGACRPLLATLAGGVTAAKDRLVRVGLWTAAMVTVAMAFVIGTGGSIPLASSIQDTGVWDTLYRTGGWRQATGFGLVGCVLLGGGAFTLRKRWKRLDWGDIGWWRLGHAVLSVLALMALVAHTGLRLGSGFNQLLMVLFLASGLFGALAVAGLGGRHARATFWIHLIVVWPLPVVLGFHILASYYF